MIFLRQSHYSNPRIYNSHRTRSHSRHNNGRQYQNSHHYNPNRIQGAQNVSCSNNPNPNSVHLYNRADLIRSITLNERLASVGGLFGALSILITGALLYFIFTARPEDKWYYISAALINISLLLLLMITAILIDRCYLKKYGSSRRCDSSNNRVINASPSPFPSQPNSVNNLNSPYPHSCLNDIPPQYPGYIESQSCCVINLKSNDSTNSLVPVSLRPVTLSLNTHDNNDSILSTDEAKHYPPPNYFELYPSKDSNSANSSQSSVSTLVFTIQPNETQNANDENQSTIASSSLNTNSQSY